MKELNKVSIVIPVYNAEKGLARCVDSILSQTYSNIELILVNDGSTDNSLQMCNTYALQDSRVRVLSIENSGSGPARNRGIQESTGKYIYFPDSDDQIDPLTIEQCVKWLNEYDSDLLVFGFKEILETGEHIRTVKYPTDSFDGEFVRMNYHQFFGMTSQYCIQGAPWNKFFTLSVVKEHNIEYPPLRRHQDEGFICRYVQYTKRVSFVDDVLYTYYANNPNAVQRKYPINYIESVIGLYRVRKETILSWNKENFKVKQMVSDEFVCNSIWAFELSFGEKYKMTTKERMSWIKKWIDEIPIEELDLTLVRKRSYQGLLFPLLFKSLVTAYAIIKLKLVIQKMVK